MPKRKRGQDDASSDPVERRRAQAEEQVSLRRTQLFRALKLAKGFERQKLSRRQKEVGAKGGSEQDRARIEGEIEALKNLDLHTAAETHLSKSLLKIKSIAASSALPTSLQVPARPAGDTATSNVLARVFNSNPVKAVMKEALAAIQAILGTEVQESHGGTSGSQKTESSAKINGTTKTIGTEEMSEEGFEGFEIGNQDLDEGSGSEFGIDDDMGDNEMGHDGPEFPTQDNSDYDSDQFAAFRDRLADTSDEEIAGDDESDLDSESSYPIHKPGLKDQINVAPTKLPALSPSPTPSPPPTSTKQPAKQLLKPSASNTAFLPTLTMGGYWSGSESEPEDLEEELSAPKKKNRRGQRARQAIWEKKYGAGAKHLSGEGGAGGGGKAVKDRNNGWDIRKGATSRDDLRPWQRKKLGIKPRGHGPPGVEGSNAIPIKKMKVFGEKTTAGKGKGGDSAEGPLHPSWEAKKRLKEAIAMPAFQGKKVTFD